MQDTRDEGCRIISSLQPYTYTYPPTPSTHLTNLPTQLTDPTHRLNSPIQHRRFVCITIALYVMTLIMVISLVAEMKFVNKI